MTVPRAEPEPWARRALVVGGASWNRMIHLPELPGSAPRTMFATRSYEAVGSSGAGKAMNLARLGYRTTLWALLGRDARGDLVRAALAEAGVALVAVDDPLGTMHHVDLMAPDGERISIFAESGTLDLAVDATAGAAVDHALGRAALIPLAAEADVVAVSIFEHCRPLLGPLRDAGAQLWVDLHDYDGVNPYHDDFIAAASFLQLSHAALPGWRAFAERHVELGCRAVVCTLGADGAQVATPAGWTVVPAARVDRLVDSNGAGDAFFAGFASGWTQGLDVAACGARGARAAADAVRSEQLAAPWPPPAGDATPKSGTAASGRASEHVTGSKSAITQDGDAPG
jgi:sugar/nucleoside kinase (ribokinase family)